jgi:hypothetical protein
MSDNRKWSDFDMWVACIAGALIIVLAFTIYNSSWFNRGIEESHPAVAYQDNRMCTYKDDKVFYQGSCAEIHDMLNLQKQQQDMAEYFTNRTNDLLNQQCSRWTIANQLTFMQQVKQNGYDCILTCNVMR